MNKNVFLVDLSKCLGFMTETEREEALEYYKELFDEAGPENEQKVLAQLGSPTKVAVELHRSYDRSHADTTGAERLLRGNFAAGDTSENAEEEAPAEETSVAETLPDIEEVLKEISAMDEPAAEETVTEETLAEESVETEEPAAQPEDEPAEEAEPAAEESVVEMLAEETVVEESVAEETPAADKSEPVFVDVPVPARVPAMAEEKSGPEVEPLEKIRGTPGWAIALIMVFTCWLWLPIFVSLLAVAISIGVSLIAVGITLLAVAAYLVICAIWALGVITDALLMVGAAAIALAFALVILWLGIWAMVMLIRLLLRGTAATYRGVFGRPKKECAK